MLELEVRASLKYKEFLNLGTRKFHSLKYKEFFLGGFFYFCRAWA